MINPDADSKASRQLRVDPEIESLIPGFLDNQQKNLTLLVEAVCQGDFETAGILGHRMKGSGRTYGFEGITVIGDQIETAAKQRDSVAIRARVEALSLYLSGVGGGKRLVTNDSGDGEEYDEVTGLPTNTYFHQLLEDTWRGLNGLVCSIITFDIQGFPDFVKKYGQQTGDECLRRIATAAEAVVCRPGCRLARYTADRFLIMLPGIGRDDGEAIVRDLKRQVEGLELALDISYRLSIGSAREGTSLARLLLSAIDLPNTPPNC